MGTWAVPRTKIRVPVVDADLGYRSGVSGTGLAKMGLMHRQITGCRICGSEWLDVLRSEEHTSELQSLAYLVCRLLLEKKKKYKSNRYNVDNNNNCYNL